jgi:hypothetical protein
MERVCFFFRLFVCERERARKKERKKVSARGRERGRDWVREGQREMNVFLTDMNMPRVKKMVIKKEGGWKKRQLASLLQKH